MSCSPLISAVYMFTNSDGGFVPSVFLSLTSCNPVVVILCARERARCPPS